MIRSLIINPGSTSTKIAVYEDEIPILLRTIIHSSEEEIAKLVDKVLEEAPKGKVMLGAECTVSDAPLGNIQTAVYTAHHQ